MKIKRLFPLYLVALFLLTSETTSAFAANATAKSAITKAQEVAVKWQPDAKLVQVSTFFGNDDGTADKWSYMFNSPSAKQGYKVDAKDGEIVNKLEVSSSFTDAIDLDFTDSSLAMTEAQRHGLIIKGKSAMTLQVMLQKTKEEGPYWNILGDRTSDKESILINAKTGKFYPKR